MTRPLRIGALALALTMAAAGRSSAQALAPAGDAEVALFDYDRSAPLAFRDSLVRQIEGIEVRAFRFHSPRGGDATGRLFVPRGGGRRPAVLLMHGMPAHAEHMTPQAVYIARRGAVVLALDAPFARRQGPPLWTAPTDSAEQVQLIVDLQRAVDVLEARTDVDPTRMAYVGRSYGGAMGALLAGVERRLRTYVLQVADGGLVTHTLGADGQRPPPRSVPAARWDAWVAAMRPVEPIRFVHRAAPASLLFQNALQDRSVARADAEALHHAASEPKTVRWYDTGHALDAAAHLEMLEWLHRTVGTAPPGPGAEQGPDYSLRPR